LTASLFLRVAEEAESLSDWERFAPTLVGVAPVYPLVTVLSSPVFPPRCPRIPYCPDAGTGGPDL